MADLIAGRALAGRHVLIVEDHYLIGASLREVLTQAGAEVLGPIGVVEEALSFVEAGAPPIHVAVLDVSLHGQTSYPVADALARRGIPYVFMTGFGADAMEEPYRHQPRCEKPVNEAALLRALVAALG
jgi:DNA-binding NarL/FixJ family response regulator